MNIGKKLKINISLHRIFVYIYILVGVVSISVFCYISVFLYNNFYKTVAQSEEVLILKREVVADNINTKKFENVLATISAKMAKRELNIFLQFK